jgi:DNA-binding response OmpR family regulator
MNADSRVLLVDDFDDARTFTPYLRDHGLNVITARGPEDAHAALEIETPGIVLTDVAFADTAIDGFAFIRSLRSIVDESTSILVLTRYARFDDRERARAAGADLYLTQPALPSAVLFEVKRALILRRSGRRLPWNWPRHAPPVPLSLTIDRRRSG